MLGGTERFFPAEVHNNAAVFNYVQGFLGGGLSANLNFTNGGATPNNAVTKAILSRTGAFQPTNRSQCYLSGAPELNWNLPSPGVYGGPEFPSAFTRGVTTAVMPNQSVKLSENGMSRWPSSAGPAAHFSLAVQRATLSTPAYLER